MPGFTRSATMRAVSRLADGAAAGRVGGRVPQHEQPLAARRAVVGDLGDRLPHSSEASRAGCADGGRREDEGGIGAVVRAEAAQPAQQVGDVAAEDAAQHVELVDHDVAQAHEEGGPALVVGQEADVQHLGVGRAPRWRCRAPRCAPRAWCRRRRWRRRGGARRAARGRGAGPGPAPWWGTAAARSRGARLRDGLGDRRLVAERLARRRARGDRHRGAVAGQVDGLGLVGPEPVDGERVPHLGCQRAGQLAEARRAGGQALEVDQPIVARERLEEPVEPGRRGGDGDGHRAMLRVAPA